LEKFSSERDYEKTRTDAPSKREKWKRKKNPQPTSTVIGGPI